MSEEEESFSRKHNQTLEPILPFTVFTQVLQYAANLVILYCKAALIKEYIYLSYLKKCVIMEVVAVLRYGIRALCYPGLEWTKD